MALNHYAGTQVYYSKLSYLHLGEKGILAVDPPLRPVLDFEGKPYCDQPCTSLEMEVSPSAALLKVTERGFHVYADTQGEERDHRQIWRAERSFVSTAYDEASGINTFLDAETLAQATWGITERAARLLLAIAAAPTPQPICTPSFVQLIDFVAATQVE